MILDYLKDKKILILGFAREGKDTLQFLRKFFPKKTIGVADRLEARSLEIEARKTIKKEKNIRTYFGQDYLKSIGDYNVIIKSPGISPKTIKPFFKSGQTITSQTEIFFENCPGKIIGITGTKGKSTTTSLIYGVLRGGGLKAHLVGNIGEPVLSHLFKAGPDDIFIYELSSHQLMGLKKSPEIAVFLNIYPEHLDYYHDFKEYLKAKQNICRYQAKSDFFLYNPDNRYVRQAVKITKARKIALNPQKAKTFLKKCGRSDLPQYRRAGLRLLGEFNFLNMAAAIEVGRIFGVPDYKIVEAIRNFKPLPHRLEFAGEFNGVKFYNDSLATIPEATIAALDALGSKVETIFLGGFDRDLDFKELAKRILKSRARNLVFFPSTGKRIWQEIKSLDRGNRFFNKLFVGKMESGETAMQKAVAFVYKYTQKGKICLLSCASPSFGTFKDYRERGELFKKYIHKSA
jgi:UDP-N-acetylmuramoylalanine--D-glutamate ligase